MLNNNLSDESYVPTLCLNMIVKNESKIITRLLESVSSVIDCYCICDTGSTDNTKELITEFFQKKNIPGKIVEEPFKNFSHNRNVAMYACNGMSDYILMMDADMVLLVKNFNKKMLKKADTFYLLQGTEDFYYHNVRIIKNNSKYKYFAVTHEYLGCTIHDEKLQINKDELFILDIGDGGAKSDKYERDIRLLTEGIKEEPNNVRYHFYLANSYHDCGEYDKAIEYYKKRINLKDWEQEVWYSYYRIGLILKKTDRIEESIYWWLGAYEVFPYRVENLYEIIEHYRIISKHKLALQFYNLAKNTLQKIITDKVDKDSFLFLHNDVYTHKLEYEYTIIACYLGIKNINNEVVTILNNTNNWSLSSNLFSNMKFYKYILQPKSTIDLSNKFTYKINNELVEFRSSSTCIIKYKKRYILNVRYVNYEITNDGSYIKCDKHITTINKYMLLNKKFKVKKEKIFDLNIDNRRYMGIEDVRIFYDSTNPEIESTHSDQNDDQNDDKDNDKDNDSETILNKLMLIGTCYKQNTNIGICIGNYDITKDQLSAREVNSSFNDNSCEKNWVFVKMGNTNRIIYNWSPITICDVNNMNNSNEDMNISIYKKINTPKIFKYTRGSTCGFNYNNEIWFVLHLVSYENPRHYYHMMAVFDNDMNLQRYSAPFKFSDTCIEYCLGLVVEDSRVIMTYSQWDRTSILSTYDKEDIDKMLVYV
jgi:tetratricopeptide (TPR) repeat protein